MEIIGIFGTFALVGALGAIGILYGIVQHLEDRDSKKISKSRAKYEERVRWEEDQCSIGTLYVDDKMYDTFSEGPLDIHNSLTLSIVHQKSTGLYGVGNIYYKGKDFTEYMSEDDSYESMLSKAIEILQGLVSNGSITQEMLDEVKDISYKRLFGFNENVKNGYIIKTKNGFDWNFNV